MSKIEILVIGRHPEILQTVLRLINNNQEWNAIGAETDKDAIALFKANQCKLVLLGGGVEQASEEKLRAEFLTINPEIIIALHYGGGSGLLAAEIYEALAGRTRF